MTPRIKIEGALTFYSNADLGIQEKMFSSTCIFLEQPQPTTYSGKDAVILGHEPTGVVTQKKVEDEMGNVEYIDVPMEGTVLISILGTNTITSLLASSLDQN